MSTNLDAFLAQLQQTIQANLDRAGDYLVNKVQKKISIINPGNSPSAPGDPPKLVTGELYDSISYRKGLYSVEVIASAKHGKPLEFGTSRMAARPFLRPTMTAEADAVTRILGGEQP